MSDLAAAYFVRGMQEEELDDLVLALAWIDKAVQMDGHFHEALFNRALFLQEMSLPIEAWLAWQSYLSLAEEPGWTKEAEERLRSLKKTPFAEAWLQERQRLVLAAERGDSQTVESVVARFRQPARKYVEETVLGQWGDAMVAGDVPRAERFLGLARTIGQELIKAGGDEMIHDVVAVIDEARLEQAGSARLRNLVEGHREYSRGLQERDRGQIDLALPFFQVTERALREGGSPFVHWARLQIASCSYLHDQFNETRRSLEEVERLLPAGRYSSLRGRLHFILGSMDVLEGRPGDSLKRFKQARDLFTKIQEAESVATMDQQTALSLGALGSAESSHYLFLAYRHLGEVQTDKRVLAIFEEEGLSSLRHGQPQVALYFQNEFLRHAQRSRDSEEIAAALQRRADTLSSSGHAGEALRDLTAASRQAERIADPHIRSRMKAHIAVSLGQIHVVSNPDLAVRELTEAIEYFRATPYRFYLSLAFLLRARSRLATGDNALAREDFDSGLQDIESTRKGLIDERLRIAFTDQATRLFDEILAFEAGEGGGAVAAFNLGEKTRARELLENLEVSALSRESSPVAPPQLLPVEEIQAALSEGTLVLKYAVLPDRLLLWSLTKKELTLHILPIEMRELGRQVDQAASSMRSGDGGQKQARRVLRDLYTSLLTPVEKNLQGAHDVVIVPDKSLHRLPFSAMVEPGTGRYLIQDHTVAVAPSVNIYVRCLSHNSVRRSEPWESLLAIGDPSFDRAAFPLSRLPDAALEATEIAAMYPRAVLLTGNEATKHNIFRQTGHGPDVMQISAHSIVSAEHPEYSRLLLAQEPRTGDSGVLYQYEVRHFDLQSTKLVVLAGCGTGSGGISNSEGSMSFARAFLSAGVPVVIASLWDVNDSASHKLFSEFHRRLRSGENPLTALRSAQLILMSNPDEASRPWGWAAYQLLGGSRPN